MSNTTLQSAPPAVAPPAQKDFVHLPAFPAEGPQVLTVIAHTYDPAYVNPFDVPPKDPYPAIKFYLGADTEAGVGLLESRWERYSLHEMANYPKLYKLATGKAPTAGSSPDDMNGHAMVGEVTNTNKVSKKGKAYTATRVTDFAAVHPKLKGEITPLAKLRPLLDAALKGDSKQPEAAKDGAPY